MSYRWILRMDSLHICYLYLLAVIGFCYGAGVLPDRSLVGVIGGSVTFNRASAQPFTTLQWKVNGTTIILNYISSTGTLKPEDGYRDRINLDRSSGSLELMNLVLTDSGQYTVTILTPEAVSVAEKTKLEVYAEGFLTPGLSAGAIAGIVIGVLLVVGVAVGVAVYFMKKKGFFKKESSSGRSVDNTGKSPANGGGPGGNQELNYADITQFQKKDGGSVQLGNLGTSSTEYAQVRVNNRPSQLT
ncbi:uncharacterized protein LOC115184092 [Salmo trutta]|uniref:uncharacterized protein LOC115184092 n=1 Tax=Salmo trutta TaxID=8032 RepID=UPI00113076AF|nr:uncharacterized protein LOC115184092 [Salmo trutta]